MWARRKVCQSIFSRKPVLNQAVVNAESTVVETLGSLCVNEPTVQFHDVGSALPITKSVLVMQLMAEVLTVDGLRKRTFVTNVRFVVGRALVILTELFRDVWAAYILRTIQD